MKAAAECFHMAVLGEGGTVSLSVLLTVWLNQIAGEAFAVGSLPMAISSARVGRDNRLEHKQHCSLSANYDMALEFVLSRCFRGGNKTE